MPDIHEEVVLQISQSKSQIHKNLKRYTIFSTDQVNKDDEISNSEEKHINKNNYSASNKGNKEL